MINLSSSINKLLTSLIKIDGCYNSKYFSFHQFHYSFHQILFCLHPALHAEVSQPVCKPSQITDNVIPMTQKISNRRKHRKLVKARNTEKKKKNQHRSNHQKVLKIDKTLCRCSSPLVIIS